MIMNFLKYFLMTSLVFAANPDPSNTFKFGNGTPGDKKLIMNRGASNPQIRWSESFQKLQFSLDGTNFTNFGSGSGGGSGTTYISSDFDDNIDSWTTYADAAGSTPVDCTGGSPVLTAVRSTSSPLYGAGSLLITKDAANRQGNGVSRAFTIDAGQQGKMLSLAMDYKVNSGVYDGGSAVPPVDSDLTWWVYDVTNAQLIPVTANRLDGTNSGSNYFFQGSFQAASNSTSYRMCLHQAKTGTSAYSLKADNIRVSSGPVAAVGGVVSSTQDIKSFVSLVGASNGLACTPVTVLSATMQRIGNVAHFISKFRFTGTLATCTGALRIDIANGLQIDPTNYSVNFYGYYDNRGAVVKSSTNDRFDITPDVSNGGGKITAVLSLMDGQTANHSNTDAGGSPIAYTTGDEVTAEYSVPILGWQTATTIGQDASDKMISVKYHWTSASTLTSIPSNAVTVIDYNAMDWDTCGCVTTGSAWTFTAPVGGFYLVSAYNILNTNPAVDSDLIAYVNGTVAAYIAETDSNGSTEILPGGMHVLKLNAGDAVNIRIFQRNTTNAFNDAGAQNNALNFVDITRLQGPSSAQPTESVNAHYNTTTAQAFTGGGAAQIVDYNIKDFDSNGSVTTGASWKFTAPVAGTYRFTAHIRFAAASGGGVSSGTLYLYKNGVLWSELGAWVQATGTNPIITTTGSDTVKLLAGEYADVRWQSPDYSISLNGSGTANHVDVTKAGNY